jgi:hypothetical protein
MSDNLWPLQGVLEGLHDPGLSQIMFDRLAAFPLLISGNAYASRV